MILDLFDTSFLQNLDLIGFNVYRMLNLVTENNLVKYLRTPLPGVPPPSRQCLHIYYNIKGKTQLDYIFFINEGL